MKGTFKLFTLVLMAMSVFSCSKESVKEFEDEINRGAVTITAGINNDAKTKTTLGDTSGESTKVYWEEGDSFVLSIGGEDYTFEIDPAYSNENPSTYATFTCADAPETIAAGDYVAKYSNVDTPTQQAGTKEGLSDYQYMEADIDIDAERNLEDVSIKFYTKVSVVELTLTHDDFKDAAVSSIALRNGGAAVAEIDGSASFTGDSNGKIVVYFAVPAGKEFTATTITATCDDNTYSATINSALTTVEGKLYQVKKSMTQRNIVASGTCGDDLEWKLTYTDDENSLTLSITGTGDMYDYDYDYDSTLTPWIEYVDRITSVKLPSGLTSIGESAFFRCGSLTSIEIPASVTEIGDFAFMRCGSLTSIEIPASVTEIRRAAFSKCEKLESVTFEAGSQLKKIGNGAFAGIGITSIEIPAAVTEIGSAFSSCKKLESVTFESGSQLKKIGDNAFNRCSAFTSIEIPASVTEIGDLAFYQCEELESVTFEAGSQLKKIGVRTFWLCSALTSIEIPASVTEIGFAAFSNCEELASVTFEAGSQLKKIGYGAFALCSALTSIEIPASVTEIGEDAFLRCTKLESVTFEAGSQLKKIGYSAFEGCGSLTSIEIPAAVTWIGGSAFYCCTSLVAVHCKPVTPPELGEDVFYTNGTGRKIYVPKSSVGGYKKAANWSTYEDHIIGE